MSNEKSSNETAAKFAMGLFAAVILSAFGARAWKRGAKYRK